MFFSWHVAVFIILGLSEFGLVCSLLWLPVHVILSLSISNNVKPKILITRHEVTYHQWPFQEPKSEVPTICKAYKAYVREYPYKIWSYNIGGLVKRCHDLTT